MEDIFFCIFWKEKSVEEDDILLFLTDKLRLLCKNWVHVTRLFKLSILISSLGVFLSECSITVSSQLFHF